MIFPCFELSLPFRVFSGLLNLYLPLILYIPSHLNLIPLLLQSFDLPYMENEVSSSSRGRKRGIAETYGDNDQGATYKFKILLPSGTSLGLTLHQHKLSDLLMPMQEFIGLVRAEHFRSHGQLEAPKIMWRSKDLYLVDICCTSENKMKDFIDFRTFGPRNCHVLLLNVRSYNNFLCTVVCISGFCLF